MMKTYRNLVAVLLSFLLLFCAACGPAGTADTAATSQEAPSLPADDHEIRVAVLNGTTGFGIAPLYQSLKEGKTDFRASVDFYADASLIPPLIVSGSADIAAVPTNLAPVLYAKTGGGIRVLAVNTLGVLYLVENGDTVKTLADLAGKTVCVPGQGSNPEYVLRALLKLAGIEDRVTIDAQYASPDELTSALAAGKAQLGVIPEPKVTAALSKNNSLRTALDFTAEWKALTGTDLVQGCLIARADFTEAHPALCQAFLKAYEASAAAVAADPAAAAAMIVSAGLAPSEQLVTNALPRCNITCMTGDEMKNALTKFWGALYDVIPSSVGGAVPDDGIFVK